MTLALSVLDQSPIRSGSTAADAIRETIELAQTCERLGYRLVHTFRRRSDGLGFEIMMQEARLAALSIPLREEEQAEVFHEINVVLSPERTRFARR